MNNPGWRTLTFDTYPEVARSAQKRQPVAGGNRHDSLASIRKEPISV